MKNNFNRLNYIINNIKYMFIIIIFASVSQNIAFCSEKKELKELDNFRVLVGAPEATILQPSLEIAFFNVGQGNCTVIKAPDKQNIFIIDAGTSKRPHNIVLQDEEVGFTDKAVTQSIKHWISNSDKPNYFIRFIVSHADEDHKSYISELIALFTDKEEKGRYYCAYSPHPKIPDVDLEKDLELV